MCYPNTGSHDVLEWYEVEKLMTESFLEWTITLNNNANESDAKKIKSFVLQILFQISLSCSGVTVVVSLVD